MTLDSRSLLVAFGLACSVFPGCRPSELLSPSRPVTVAHPKKEAPPPLSPAETAEPTRDERVARASYPQRTDPPRPEPLPQPLLMPPMETKPPPVASVPPPVESKPLVPDPAVVGSLRYLLAGKPDKGVEELKVYDPANQELLLRLLPLVARLAEPSTNAANPAMVTHLLDQVSGIEAELRQRAPLTIAKMTFCQDIRQFGAYDPLPPEYEFRAGVAGAPGELVNVYVELQNLSTRAQGEWFETSVARRLEIRDSKGELISVEDKPAGIYRSRSQAHDTFLHCKFEIPAKVPPGPYTLWIQVEDALSQPRRIARRPLDFRVTSQPQPSNSGR